MRCVRERLGHVGVSESDDVPLLLSLVPWPMMTLICSMALDGLSHSKTLLKWFRKACFFYFVWELV